MRELVRVLGLSSGRIRSLLRALIEAGQVSATRVRCANMLGEAHYTPVYSLKK